MNFSKDSPLISDSDYDILKKEVLNLLKDFPFLKKIFKISSLIRHLPLINLKKKTFKTNVIFIKRF